MAWTAEDIEKLRQTKTSQWTADDVDKLRSKKEPVKKPVKQKEIRKTTKSSPSAVVEKKKPIPLIKNPFPSAPKVPLTPKDYSGSMIDSKKLNPDNIQYGGVNSGDNKGVRQLGEIAKKLPSALEAGRSSSTAGTFNALALATDKTPYGEKEPVTNIPPLLKDYSGSMIDSSKLNPIKYAENTGDNKGVRQIGELFNKISPDSDAEFSKFAETTGLDFGNRVFSGAADSYNQRTAEKAEKASSEDPFVQGVSSTAQSVGNMLPSIATSIMGGNPLLATGLLATSKAGNAANEAKLSGASKRQQEAIFATQGLSELVTEYLPFKYLGRIAKSGLGSLVTKGVSEGSKAVGNKAFKDWAANTAINIAQEIAVTPIDIASKNAILGTDEKYSLDMAKEDARGALAISVIFTALGLPATMASNKMAQKVVSSGKPATLVEISQVAEQLNIDGVDVVKGFEGVKETQPVDQFREPTKMVQPANQIVDPNKMVEPLLKPEQTSVQADLSAPPLMANNNTNIQEKPLQSSVVSENIGSSVKQYDINKMNDAKSIETALAEVERIRVEQPDTYMKMNLRLFSEQAQAKLKELAKQSIKDMESKGKLKDLMFPFGRIDVEGLKSEAGDLISTYPLKYNEINNKDTLTAANKLVKTSPEAAKNLVREGEVYDNAVESAIGMKVIEDAFAQKNFDEAFELLDRHSEKLKKMGQGIQINAAWARATPEGMVKQIDRFVKKAKERGVDVKVSKEFKQQIYEEMQVINDITNPSDMIKQIEKASGKKLGDKVNKNLSEKSQEALKELAVEQVLQKIVKTAPVSAWRKLSTIQAMSHLLNIPTTLRNIFSNTTFNEVERFSNVLAIPMDRLIGTKTDSKAVAYPTARRKTLDAGFKRASNASTRIQLGLPAVSNDKYNIKTNTFIGNKPLDKILSKGEKAMAYELQVTDEFQKGIIEADVIDQFKRLTGSEEITAEMKKIAEAEAEYRTFQDDSVPATVLGEIGKVLNLIGVGKTDQKLGKWSVKEFGLRDLTIKYTRVAGNIISRTIEYTPMGYVKMINNLAKAEGNLQKQRTAAMAFGRATNGSLMLGMGAVLKGLGVLVKQEDDENRNKSALNSAAGLLTTYKLNISAIGRLFNGESAKLQEGDYLTTYAWLEPVSKSFSMGAAIYDEINKGGSAAEITFASLNQGLVEILDLPVLSVIKSMTYQESAVDVLFTPVAESVSGFVPGPVRQLSNTLDPFSREQYSGTPLERSAKRIKASIPGLKQTLEPSLTGFGDKKSTYGKDGLAAFNQLLNPGSISKYAPNEFDKELKELEESTGLTDQYPISKAPNYITVKKERLELTDKEKTEYMETAGDIISRKYRRYFKEGKFNDYDGKEKSEKLQVNELRDIVESAREEAKLKIYKKYYK